MGEEIKRWTARRKSALVLEIIRGKATVTEASRQFDLTPSEIESWVEDGKRGMGNALRAKPEDVREQYERQLKDLQEAHGEAMLELRAKKKIGVPVGQGRDLMVSIQQGLRDDTPHCPQQNGMVERVVRTLKEQWAHRHRFESQQHASRVIGDWIQFYSHRRPHQALGMKTPA